MKKKDSKTPGAPDEENHYTTFKRDVCKSLNSLICSNDEYLSRREFFETEPWPRNFRVAFLVLFRILNEIFVPSRS